MIIMTTLWETLQSLVNKAVLHLNEELFGNKGYLLGHIL